MKPAQNGFHKLLMYNFNYYTFSTIKADASPPPIHREASPYFASVLFISCNKVVNILAPLAPIG